MNNEEKSKLLTPCALCSRICKVHGVESNEPCNTYYALMVMASWKDEQHKNFVKNACEIYRDELKSFCRILARINKNYEGLIDIKASVADFRKKISQDLTEEEE